MKICVVQIESVAGEVAQNIARHRLMIETAVAHNPSLIIFPELSLTGYEPTLAAELATEKDDGRFHDFQTLSDAHGVTIGVGMPTRVASGVSIGLILFQPHAARRLYAKRYLHADEEPFFVSGENFPVMMMDDEPLALAICYELSVAQHAATAHAAGAAVYVASVAKSARGMAAAAQRLAQIARDYGMSVLIANSVGPSDDFVGAGQTAVWNAHGQLLAQLDATSQGWLLFDTVSQQTITYVMSYE